MSTRTHPPTRAVAALANGVPPSRVPDDRPMAVYAVRCTWWDEQDHGFALMVEGGRRAGDLPRCPSCGSVLMQTPLEKLDAHLRSGEFTELEAEAWQWQKGQPHCWPTLAALVAAYEDRSDDGS